MVFLFPPLLTAETITAKTQAPQNKNAWVLLRPGGGIVRVCRCFPATASDGRKKYKLIHLNLDNTMD